MTELELMAPLDGWVMPLDEVPDAVFATGMMGDGLAMEPTGQWLHAPCDADVLTLHSSGHAITLRATNGAELLLHIGIDTVAMASGSFTPLVAVGDRVITGQALIAFDLDAVVCSATAAISPIILTTPNYRITQRAAHTLIAAGEPLLRISRTEQADPPPSPLPGEAQHHTMQVGLPHGLHARPAARIVAALAALDAQAVVAKGDRQARCDSPVALLGLGLAHGATVTIEARGPDAPAAITAIADLLTHEVAADPVIPAAPAAPPPPRTLPAGVIAGIMAAPGLALGPATWLKTQWPEIPPAQGPEVEQARLHGGIAAADRALGTPASGSAAHIMAAHRAIVNDPALLETALAGIAAGQHAAAAFLAATHEQAAVLTALPDARLAERANDLRDVGLRVAYAILGEAQPRAEVPDGAVVLSDDLLPSDLVALGGTRVAGIVLAKGGPTSHAAILAAGAGIPMLVATGPALQLVAEGATVIVDADRGQCDASGDPARRARAEARLTQARAAEAQAMAAGNRPGRTADGTRIHVYANLGSVRDAHTAAEAGAEGCGLLRTEFLFIDREQAPDAAEQAATYQAITQALPDRPVVIRLLDIGGDKPAPYLHLPQEDNPALGLRGVRVAFARPGILDTQLRAILAVPALGSCRIMVPMVSGAAEVQAVRAALNRLRQEHGTPEVALGAMVETPAAAIGADLIAPHADFLSIGSNDLTQYALAMDRGNPAVAAGLDGLHPAVLRMIAATCDGAARHNVPVSVCGGLAADPLAVPILIGLGVTTLSVPPVRVAATKLLVSRLTIDAAVRHARAMLSATTAEHVRELARAFAEEPAA